MDTNTREAPADGKKSALHRLVLRLATISRHPFMNIFLGVGLLAIGINEFIESIYPAFDSSLDVHHAVILIGIVTLMHGFVEMVERMEKVVTGTPRHRRGGAE